MSSKLIFLSHATADKPMISALLRLLGEGCGITKDQVFCTAYKGMAIEEGFYANVEIRKELSEAKLCIALLSPNYYASAYCLCELGATWVRHLDHENFGFYPLIIPPFGYVEGLKAVISGVEARTVDRGHLGTLRDSVEKYTKKRLGTPQWEEAASEFVANLEENLGKIPAPKIATWEELDRTKKDLADYKESFQAQKEQIEDLQDKIEQLKKAKDAEAVADILAEDLEDKEQFTELCEAVKGEIIDLLSPTKRVIFYTAKNEVCTDQENWGHDNYVPALDAGELKWVEEHRGVGPSGYMVNGGKGPIKRALAAVEELRSFLDSEASETFFEWYEEEFDEEPDIDTTTFWDRHLR